MAFYRKSRPPRVFLGVREVAGYYANLERGFATLDVPCTRLMTARHKFEYVRATWLERQAIALADYYKTLNRKRFWGRSLSQAILTIEKLLTAWVIWRHDIFIFGATTSLSDCLTGKRKFTDLGKISRAGKTAIFVFHGSEVRPPWLNGATKDLTPAALAVRDARIGHYLSLIETQCDAIVSHPPMALKQRKPFAQYLAMGVPFAGPAHPRGASSSALAHQYRKGIDRTRILHAPSSPEFKGTAIIQETLEALQADGHLIDYIKITNMPHSAVLSELGRADLVIDQVYSDTPMAHFATEAAYFGVPTVVCGLDLPELNDHIPSDFRPPSQIGHPDDLHRLVLEMIEDPVGRRELGARAQVFVQQRWAPDAVARRFLKLACDQAPSEWFHDPTADQRFTGGWGMSMQYWKRNVMRYFLHRGLLEDQTDVRAIEHQLHALCMAGLESRDHDVRDPAGTQCSDWQHQMAMFLLNQGLDNYPFTSSAWRTDLRDRCLAILDIRDNAP